jgi:hypothetical protein
MAVAPTALVGLASGYRSGMERNRRQRIEEEDRQIGLADLDRNRRRQDAADARAEEDHQARMEDRQVQAGLREATRKQQESELQRQMRERQGRAIYNLARLAEEGTDPSSFIEMGGQDLPPGTTFDAATGEIVIAGPDGAQRRYNAKEIRAGLEPVFGTQKKDDGGFTLGEGQTRFDAQGNVIARGQPKAPGGERGPPSGYRWKADGTLEAIPGGPADKGGAGGVKPITPAEQRLRSTAVRSALDTRTKNQFGSGSTLSGEQKQQYGAIADRMIAKYGTAAPGADDLAQIILGHMSSMPTLSQLVDEEVMNLKASGQAPRTGWFDGVSDKDAARRVATETAKAKLATARQQVESLIEADVADIAAAYYGYGGEAASPAAAGGAASGAAPAASNAPVGVDGKPLW